MPYRHVALYRWAEHVDEAHVERVSEAIDTFAEQVIAESAGERVGVLAVTHGRDVGMVGDAHDYVVVIDVAATTDWRALRDDPRYIVLVGELITPHVADQAAGQFRIDQPAALAAPTDDIADLTDDELMARARRAAQASMDALMAEPDV